MAANTGKNPKQSSGLHPLLVRFAERAEDMDAYKASRSGLDLTAAYQCYLYRLEPSTYTGGAEYLRSFSEVPDENTVKNLFGGGRYQLRIFQNGRIQPGPANFRISGNPKLVAVEDDDAPDEKPVVSESSDGVLFGILERKINGLEEKIAQVLRGVETASGGGDSLSPERLSRLIDVANAKRLESQLLTGALGAPETKPAPAGAVSPSGLSPDMLEMVLKIFRAGVDFAGSSGDGDTDDIVSKGLSHLMDLFTKATGKTAPVSAVEPPRVSPAPDVRVDGSPDPERVEIDRRAVEREYTERKETSMMERLQRAVGVMLDAFSAGADYSVDDICAFVWEVLPPEQIGHIKDNLTFVNVRMLMEGSPESQIELDTYKDGVESVLTRLKTVEGGTPVSDGPD